MRILAIRGENIASLGAFAVDLDVEPLRSAGVFAIVGATGAGKSSLLDALCLALYHDVPRLHDVTAKGIAFESAVGPRSLGDPSHVIRRGCATARAEVDFMAGDGHRYRAQWGYRAPARRGARPQENIALLDLDSNQLLLRQKTETAERIRELVGLDFGQFTRTVLLAQGQFAAFLTASDAEDRALILEQLTGTDRFTRIGQAIAERSSAEEASCRVLDEARRAWKVLETSAREELEIRRQRTLADLASCTAATDPLAGLHVILDRGAQAQRTMARLEPERVAALARLETLEQGRQAVALEGERAQQAWGALQPELERAQALDVTLAGLGAALERQQATLAREERRQRERDQRLIQQRLALAANSAQRDDLARWLEARRYLEPRARQTSFVAEQLSVQLEAHRAIPALAARLADLDGELPARVRAMAAAEVAVACLDTALAGIELTRLPELGAELDRRATELALREEVQRISTRLEATEREAEALAPQLAAATNQRDAAQAALRTATEVTEGAVEQLRARLLDGEPCAVCGARDHPFASLTEAALRDQVRRRRDELARAEKSHRALLEGAQRTGTTATQLARLLAENTARADAIVVQDPEALACQTLTELDAVRARHRHRTEALQALQERRLELERERSEHARLVGERERSCDEAAGIRRRAEAARNKLEALWPFADYGDELHRDGDDFVRAHREELDQYVHARDRDSGAAQEVEKLAASIAALEEECRAATGAIGDLAREVADRAATLVTERAERSRLLGGEPVSSVRSRTERALADAKQAQQGLDAAAQSHRNDALRLGTELASAGRDLEETSSKLLELGAVCERSLAPLGLPLSASPGDWSKVTTDAAAAWLDAARTAVAARRDDAARVAGALEEQVRLDDEHRHQLVALDQQLAEKRQVAGRWAQLDGLLGRGGGKAFRTLAQQYTLETLLDQANQHLHEITPRFSLHRLEESLHFVVVDHDSYDAARPVNTLSGGETFIVSLALALSLSALVSGRHAVETLFIDEGFGSLDGDTLRHVMKALDALHAQGRKVGLITHVEEMKDRIPTRVEVRKVRPGLSSVHVIG